MYMSLIYTCILCGNNPFDYLTELQKHSSDVFKNPEKWMPWNYREAIAQMQLIHFNKVNNITTKIKGFEAPFKKTADSQLVKIGYDTGLGNDNSAGLA